MRRVKAPVRNHYRLGEGYKSVLCDFCKKKKIFKFADVDKIKKPIKKMQSMSYIPW